MLLINCKLLQDSISVLTMDKKNMTPSIDTSLSTLSCEIVFQCSASSYTVGKIVSDSSPGEERLPFSSVNAIKLTIRDAFKFKSLSSASIIYPSLTEVAVVTQSDLFNVRSDFTSLSLSYIIVTGAV